MPWLSAPRLNAPPCAGGNPHLQISFLNEPAPPPQAGVSLGAPALPHSGTCSCRVPRVLCPCQCPQGGHPDPPSRPKGIPALPWPGGCTSRRCDG